MSVCEKIEKIETFIRQNLKIFEYDLNFSHGTPPPPLGTQVLIMDDVLFHLSLTVDAFF